MRGCRCLLRFLALFAAASAEREHKSALKKTERSASPLLFPYLVSELGEQN
jgi:hypothetical protein